MDALDRRAFLATVGAVLLAVRRVEGQPAGRFWRIGFLGDGRRAERLAISYAPFQEGLRNLGYVEGQNLVIEERWSDGSSERLTAHAMDLARLNPDVIVTHGLPGARATQAATRTIPIVVAVTAEFVTTGLAASLARPGGNITGMTDQVAEVSQKQIQLLREMLPRLKRLAILWNERNLGAKLSLDEIRKVAEDGRLEVGLIGVTEAAQLDDAVERAARSRADALVVIHDPLTVNQRARIAEAALRRRLPAVSASTPFVEAGGLMAYAASLPDLFKRAAVFVDRILKGAKPADIPVEQPTKFELHLNLRTARALGLTIPPSLSLRADRVFE
jgi:putative ABC transport system substrate-binding protein